MKKFWSIILISMFFSACKKKDLFEAPTIPELPPITEEGRNSFGCLVNGVVWIPNYKNPFNLFPPSPLGSHYDSGLFTFHAEGGGDTLSDYFSFNDWVYSPSQIILNADTSGINFSSHDTINGYYVYRSDSLHTGMLTITKIDSVNRIIAGTFYFDAIDTARNQVVHITEGRFDFKY